MIGRPKRTDKEIIEDLDNQLETKYKINAKGCWIWIGNKFENGYPRLSRCRPNSKYHERGHIASYQKHKGKIKKGLFVCHTCDNKACINPEHLWLGTNRDNQIDAVNKGTFDKIWTKEKREAMSQRVKGKNNPMYGKRGKEAPSYGRKGSKHPMYGKNHTEDAKHRISKSLKSTWQKKRTQND